MSSIVQGRDQGVARGSEPCSAMPRSLLAPIGRRHAVSCPERMGEMRLTAKSGAIGNLRYTQPAMHRVSEPRVCELQPFGEDHLADGCARIAEDTMKIAQGYSDGIRDMGGRQQGIVQVLANVADAATKCCAANGRVFDVQFIAVGFDRDSDQVDKLPGIGAGSRIRYAKHLVGERSDEVRRDTPHAGVIVARDEEVLVELRNGGCEQPAGNGHVLYFGTLLVFPEEGSVRSIEQGSAGGEAMGDLALSQVQLAAPDVHQDDNLPIVLVDMPRRPLDVFTAAGNCREIEVADA